MKNKAIVRCHDYKPFVLLFKNGKGNWYYEHMA